jgi:hypothetical protein
VRCSPSKQLRVAAFQETVGDTDALSWMGLLVGIAVLALALGAGYAVRQGNRTRSRRYYHGD